MCYLIAKDRDAHGCFALKTSHGKNLAELKKAKGAVYFQVPSNAQSISIEFNINTFTGEKVEFIVK